MNSLVCTPCTPETDESAAASYQFCSPDSREPFTPANSNTGLGVVYDLSSDLSMLGGLPHTTTETWSGITQAMESTAIGCAEPHFWTEALQPQLRPTSVPVEGWTPMSMYHQPQISAPPLSPLLGSIHHHHHHHHSSISAETVHTILASPSLTNSRSVTPSEVNSLDDYKVVMYYFQ